MRRERFKRRPRKNLSTNARHRGGAVRSSDESPVMGLERRGCIVQPLLAGQPETGGFCWTRQSHSVFPRQYDVGGIPTASFMLLVSQKMHGAKTDIFTHHLATLSPPKN
ncbi:hypothetical protein D6F12_24585 [Salmonella enterica]|nr:hypothetical protein [Salmonella enterica]